MKAIMVMFDSLNRRMLPPYGCDWVHAPNFQRLAQHTVVFENSYAGSMPCMPARRELHTGRYNFLHRSWGPLEPFDESMPSILKAHGIFTHLASDHYHYWEDGGCTYHTRYNTWEFFRGQEGDPWKACIEDPETPPNLSERPTGMRRQDWINRGFMDIEEKQPQPQTFQNGLEFLQRNHNQDNWFLHIETFDPHEPFFTQQEYKDLYPHNYQGPHLDWPEYRRVNETNETIEHVRCEYTALVSMCDHHLGRVLDAMDEYNLWQDTLLIVNTDHGFLLGEHDWWGKVVNPFYDEIIHTPLFIWDPRSRKAGERRTSLVSTIDLAPTILEFFGIARPETMQGIPLAATIRQDTPVHDGVLFGLHGGHVNVTDGRYVYMRAPVTPANTPLYEYTLMPTHMRGLFRTEELQNMTLAEPFSFTQGCRTLRIPGRPWSDYMPYRTMLFDLQTDPRQETLLLDETLEVRMAQLLVDLMRANDAPIDQYERLGLPVESPVTDHHLLARAQYREAVLVR
ncbi:MAG: sulfatase [Anaerolineae bacterium]|nr:sulfatase [Anaerolineae bacterium]